MLNPQLLNELLRDGVGHRFMTPHVRNIPGSRQNAVAARAQSPENGRPGAAETPKAMKNNG
jgi:hypothetical protein